MVKVPISIVVYARPTRANGVSFWAFDLTALGLVALAIGYTIFLGSLRPARRTRLRGGAVLIDGASPNVTLAAPQGIALTKRLAFAASFMSFRRK
jgi:hypothetical protein